MDKSTPHIGRFYLLEALLTNERIILLAVGFDEAEMQKLAFSLASSMRDDFLALRVSSHGEHLVWDEAELEATHAAPTTSM